MPGNGREETGKKSFSSNRKNGWNKREIRRGKEGKQGESVAASFLF